MVPKLKPGVDFIYTLCHGPPQAKAYFPIVRMTPRHERLYPQWQLHWDRKFDSNVFHFLILIKTCLILFTHTFTWFFCPLPWLVVSGKVKALFRPKSSEVHPTNSQSVPSPIMDIEYIYGLPPIHYGPFRPKVGIMAHLVVTC